MPGNKLRFSDKKPTPEEFNQMREAAGWGPILPLRHAATALNNSMFCVSVYEGRQLVGMARVIGDGGYAFCIQEVIVSETHQRRGVGTRMITRLLERIDALELERAYIGLMASADSEPFYEKLGFQRRPNEQRGAGMSMSRQRPQ